MLSWLTRYASQAEAACKTGIASSIAQEIWKRAGALEAEKAERGEPPPYEERVTRKPGSGAKPKLTVNDIKHLLEAYTRDKKQRKTLWHDVAKAEGFAKKIPRLRNE